MPLSNGLIAYYKLEDLTAEVGGANLTTTGGAGFAAAKINDGLDNPGGGARLSSTSALFGLDGPATRTFAAWVKADVLAGSPGIISNWANGVGTVVQWLLWYDAGSLKFQVRDSSNVDHVATWAGSFTTGVFYHIVFSYDSATGTVSVNVDNGSPNTTTSSDVKAGTTELALGNRNNGGAGFDGHIDAFGVWDRLLTGAEQTALYNGGAGVEYPFAGVEALNIGVRRSRKRQVVA
jgi:hypothetical protein